MRLNVPLVYGRHDKGQYRIKIPTRLSWILMDSPAYLVFSHFIFTEPLPVTPPIVVLFIMWQMHHFRRAVIYPFQLQVRAGSSTPMRMTLFGAILCTACGYLNAEHISKKVSCLRRCRIVPKVLLRAAQCQPAPLLDALCRRLEHR
jgi:hypothetical protein